MPDNSHHDLRPFHTLYRTPTGDEIVSPPANTSEELAAWWFGMDELHRPPPKREVLIAEMSCSVSENGIVEAWFRTHPVDKRFECEGRLRLFEGRLILTHLALSSSGPEMVPPYTGIFTLEGISGEVLRMVPLGQLLTDAKRRLVRAAQWEGEVPMEVRRVLDALIGPVRRMNAEEQSVRRTRRSGPTGKPDQFFREIAVDYIEFVHTHNGQARGVLDFLAETHHGSRSAVRDWVRKARDRGYLASTTRGRASGLPGPRLGHKERDS